jgi:TRAP-type mannitol/chloroaromatic compound transport system permease small subunit
MVGPTLRIKQLKKPQNVHTSALCTHGRAFQLPHWPASDVPDLCNDGRFVVVFHYQGFSVHAPVTLDAGDSPILGGPYSIQLNSNVRMDLGYGVLSQKNKALVDAFTIFFLMIYLGFLLVGALNSFSYSLGNFRQDAIPFLYGVVRAFFTDGFDGAAAEFGVIERSRSIWRAPMWPIKLIMIIGFILMLLQATAEFIKDIARMQTGLEDPFGTAPKNRNLN